ncbi:hypothetical protein E2C01_101363 [Portunus trituberculatus]|uniref:Uncharacterized protein n=1 Tax=Portunus trituberculatus TaxID=210409 RepID=A0A5B7K9E6_PORTR|nr:hypothetical protein [Portunus trituberculatus]
METLHKLVSLRSGPRGLPWPALCCCSRRGCGAWLPYLASALTHPHFGSLLLVASRYQRIQYGREGPGEGEGKCRFGQAPATSIVLGTLPTLDKGFRKPSS